jgi:hypothetical protein
VSRNSLKRRLLRRPSPALVVAMIALVVASAGVANGGIGGSKLAPTAAAGPFITGTHVLDGSLTGADINQATLTAVANALHANAADVATNATHATSADVATNATNATNATHATSANTAAPTGAAGGALTGTFPNPGLATGVVKAGNLGTIVTRDNTASVAAGSGGSASVSCGPGERILSGGNDGFYQMDVVASRTNGNGWAVFAFNTFGSALTLTVHAYCLAP